MQGRRENTKQGLPSVPSDNHGHFPEYAKMINYVKTATFSDPTQNAKNIIYIYVAMKRNYFFFKNI